MACLRAPGGISENPKKNTKAIFALLRLTNITHISTKLLAGGNRGAAWILSKLPGRAGSYIAQEFARSTEFQVFTLSPIKRRVVYVSAFEIIAIILSTLFLMALSGTDAKSSMPVAAMVSVAAVVWNYLYNAAFESWEQRKSIKARTFRIRSLHTIGFEGGLILICLPIYMLWYNVGLWEAFTMELALLLFFLIYTFVFTLLFDRVFTLPQHQY